MAKLKKKVEALSEADVILDRISAINEEAQYPTDMKEAVIGMVERIGMSPVVLLDRDKCINILIKQGMTYEEALEYFEFNTIGSWVGEGTPCFATLSKSDFFS